MAEEVEGEMEGGRLEGGIKSEGGMARPLLIPIHTYRLISNPSWRSVCAVRKTKGRDIRL